MKLTQDLLIQAGFDSFDADAKGVLKAYADCNDCEGERNLNYLCVKGFTLKEAMRLLQVAIPDGYNEFNADTAISKISEVFGDKALIFIARESSVCLYIKPSQNVWMNSHRDMDINNLKADEISYDSNLNLFRVWWD